MSTIFWVLIAIGISIFLFLALLAILSLASFIRVGTVAPGLLPLLFLRE